MQDKIVKCQSCQQDFVWTKSEQKFYADKNLSQPKYCMICRSFLKSANRDQFREEIKNKK